jgi:hypothetical protein
MFDGHIPHHDPHQDGEGQYWCEFERTLKGEYCTQNGEVRLDGLMLCNRHAGILRLEERMAYWQAMVAHVELWSGEARSRGRADVVSLLEIERARASAALGRTSEDLHELEESRDGDVQDGEDGSGDGRGDGMGTPLWPPLFLLSLAVSG